MLTLDKTYMESPVKGRVNDLLEYPRKHSLVINQDELFKNIYENNIVPT